MEQKKQTYKCSDRVTVLGLVSARRTRKMMRVLQVNERVLIATCKQLVWSTRIGRNMPI